MASVNSHFLNIFSSNANFISGPEGFISWSSAGVTRAIGVVSRGSDGLLDAGTDSFIFGGITYTGYTIEFENETYAIFSNGRDYFIPYN